MKNSILLGMFMCLMTSAHAQDIPTIADGKKVLIARYEKSECLELVSFEKTNGQRSEFGGVAGYQMEYSAILGLKPGCYGAYSDVKAKFWSNPKKTFSEQGAKNMANIGYRIVKGGEKVTVKDKITFSKKENGWSGSILVF